ncbi:hypothetical protein BYT27DRAFT_6519367 [Phlegmacium glaucopus]|nr:hypothetical protein BYT27DRAFT_6519367 [Phlegmacium glaucopus]
MLTVTPAITGDITEVTIKGFNNLYVSLQVSLHHLCTLHDNSGGSCLTKVGLREMPRTPSSLGVTRNTSG